MAITTTKIDSHWNYFLSVEADLLELSRFIEFDKRNYKCFSVEMARLLIDYGVSPGVVYSNECTATFSTDQFSGPASTKLLVNYSN